MNKIVVDIAKMAVIVAVIIGGIWLVFQASDANQAKGEQERQAIRAKYGCQPTNEFVGKDAERLWLCRDGVKYKEGVFYFWARDERK